MIDARQSERSDMAGPGLLQCSGSGAQSCAGGENVIHQKDALISNTGRTFYGKGTPQIVAALCLCKAGLRLRISDAPKIGGEPQAVTFGDGFGEQFRLIESALPPLTPMHGHGENGIKLLINRQGTN